MKRGNLSLALFLISILFISGCSPGMSPFIIGKEDSLFVSCVLSQENCNKSYDYNEDLDINILDAVLYFNKKQKPGSIFNNLKFFNEKKLGSRTCSIPDSECDLADFDACLDIQNFDSNLGTIDVCMKNNQDVKGFQWDWIGAELVDYTNGPSGFTIMDDLDTIIGFSISGGVVSPREGRLITLEMENVQDYVCFTGDRLISDAGGVALNTNWGDCYCIPGYDCFEECGGNAEVDTCGTCGGDCIEECGCTGECDGSVVDCAGVCEGTAEQDCLGDCQGQALIDACDMCGYTWDDDCSYHYNNPASGCFNDQCLAYGQNCELDNQCQTDNCDACGDCGVQNPTSCFEIGESCSVDNQCRDNSKCDCTETCVSYGSEQEFDDCGVCGGPGPTFECGDGLLYCSSNDCPWNQCGQDLRGTGQIQQVANHQICDDNEYCNSEGICDYIDPPSPTAGNCNYGSGEDQSSQSCWAGDGHCYDGACNSGTSNSLPSGTGVCGNYGNCNWADIKELGYYDSYNYRCCEI